MKKAVFRAFCALTLAAALSGCDQKIAIVDGHLPPELLPYAQKLTGSYHGQFDHQVSAMEVSLDGDRLVLKSTPDVISPACQTRIGDLTELQTTERDGAAQITRAVFALDPNLCAKEIAGRELVVTLLRSEPVTFSAEYLDHVEERQHCADVGTPSGPAPAQSCHTDTITWYGTGRYIHD